MSTLQVANIHFEATGTNRIDYVSGDSIIRFTTGAVKFPVGTTATRPAGEVGLIRYNTDSGNFEGRNTSAWGTVAWSRELADPFNQANTARNQANVALSFAIAFGA